MSGSIDQALVRAAWRVSKPKILGLGFLLTVAALTVFSILIYQKAFTKVSEVTLKADHIGNQLNPHADVKMRGVIVGEVRAVRSRPDGADLTLALQPASLRLIPRDVRARILPKTLFGEKYVELVPSGDATDVSSPRIAAGDVIPQDRSQTAIELGKVFDDLVPVLRAVDPASLNSALNSLATAIQGRGSALGDNFARFDSYLTKFNPAVPQLEADLSGLADVADTYNAAAPSLLALLSNESSIANTLVAKRDSLQRVLVGSAGFSDTLNTVLKDNEANLVHLSKISVPILQTLRDNGQSLPYLFDGLVKLAPRVDAALGANGPWLHITASFVPDRGGYTAADCPTYFELKGPNCAGGGTNSIGSATDVYQANGRKPGSGSRVTAALFDDYAGNYSDVRGTTAEAQRIALLVGAASGQDPNDIAGLADVLFGPLLRGTEVTLS